MKKTFKQVIDTTVNSGSSRVQMGQPTQPNNTSQTLEYYKKALYPSPLIFPPQTPPPPPPPLLIIPPSSRQHNTIPLLIFYLYSLQHPPHLILISSFDLPISLYIKQEMKKGTRKHGKAWRRMEDIDSTSIVPIVVRISDDLYPPTCGIAQSRHHRCRGGLMSGEYSQVCIPYQIYFSRLRKKISPLFNMLEAMELDEAKRISLFQVY